MAEVKWIKITTNMFDDEKIDFIESLPESDTILIIWIKLLTLAGKCNTNGYIYLTENIPYTDEMLAHKFRRPLNTVKFALETFIRLKMIEIDDRGIFISNWEKHQNIQGLEKIKEQNRLRKRKQREREKMLMLDAKEEMGISNDDMSRDVTGQVTQCHATDIDIEEDIDIDKEKDIVSLKFDEESIQYKLTNYLKNWILKNNPNAKVPGLKDMDKWSIHVDRLMRLDKYTEQQIKDVIKWCQTNTFWMSNILSTSKLRKKFPTLLLQMSNSNKSSNKSKFGFATNTEKVLDSQDSIRRFLEADD